MDRANEARKSIKNVSDIASVTTESQKKLFSNKFLEHLFYGNNTGGMHYRGLEGATEVTNISKPLKSGVYEGWAKQVNGEYKYSTFFPDNWTPQDVLNAIEDVYKNPTKKLASGVNGFTKDGVEINIFFNKLGEIVTAYPVIHK